MNKTRSNEPRQVTAALLRFLLNVKSRGVGSGPCAATLGLSGFESKQVQLDGVQKHKGAVNNAEE